MHNIAYGGRWLDLHDGLDLKIVHVHNNLLSDVKSTYTNDTDIVASGNPWIYNIGDKDFRVKADAMQKGFKAIPYNKIGLQKDAFRAQPQKTFAYK